MWASLLYASLLALTCSCQAKEIRIPLNAIQTEEAGPQKQPVTSYYASLDVGTPPKPFKVQFDTNFNGLFVPHTLNIKEKLSAKSLHNDIGYNKKVSKTGTKEKGDGYKLPYGECTIEGKGYSDKMKLHEQDSFDIGEQRFIAAKWANCNKFLKLSVDGFIGLPRGVSNQSPGLLENLGVNKFSFRFGANKNDSQLVLGGFGSAPSKQIQWFDLSKDEPNSWALDLKGVKIGQLEVEDVVKGSKVVLSTGESDLYGPKKAVTFIREQLVMQEKKGLYLMNCKQVNSAHKFTFELANGKTLTIGVNQYIKKLRPTKTSADESCYLAVHPLPGRAASSNRWLVGTNFLSTFETLFDLTKSQVGFAELN